MVVSLFTSIIATAQIREISGQVTDDKGVGIPYASVVVKGTSTGVSADDKGFFKVKAKTGDVIVVSVVGFDSKEIKVGSGSTLNFQLVKKVDETEVVVVTTALGEKRQAKDLGYATAKVSAKDLTQSKVVNLQNGLTAKVSGLNVQTVNNGVFADTRLTIRGIRSLTGNNQPMLILDGVPVSLSYISSLNPNDIQDVTILKDASSTAIYGPDGVNGAIVVTTKRGSKNKPMITFSTTMQMENVSFMPKLQTRFGSGSSEDANGYGIYDPIENQCYGPMFDGSQVQIGRNSPTGAKFMTDYSAKPNEKKNFWNTGITTQNDLSFSTGDFYLSAQDVRIKGITPKDENHRTAFRLFSQKEYNKFKATFNVNYTASNYNITTSDIYWLLLNTPMHIPITQFKDWKNDYWASPDGYFSDYYGNPYYDLDNNRQTGKSNDVLGSLELNYKVNNWINVTERLSGTFTDAFSKSTRSALVYSQFAKASGKYIAGTDIAATVGDATSVSNRITNEFFVSAKRDLTEKLKLEVLVGHMFRETNAKSINISTSNLGIPSVFNIAARKGEPNAAEGISQTRLQRFYGKAALNYANWAFFELVGNRETNSVLGNHFNFKSEDIKYFYPAANLSVVLSEAISAIKNSKTISFLKLRAAYASTGNVNLGPYNLQNTYNAGTNFPYGTLLGFTSSNTLRASSYKPEFVKTTSVGFDIGFNKNKINLEASYYKQDNTDQIITVAYSAATGFPNALLNAASFVNKGIEFDLKLTPLIKWKKVSVDFKINYSNQQNEVYKVLEGVDELGIGNGNYVIVGKSAYTFKLTDYVRDAQGRVIVDKATGYPSQDPNLKVFGQTQPKHLLGLNLSVNYKNFSLSAVADYRGGAQIYNGIGPDMDFTGVSYRSGQNARQRFIFPNSSYDDGTGKYVANTSVYTQSGGYGFWESSAYNRAINSNYLCSGDFWKLRELALTYNIPVTGISKHIPIKGASFTITGRNLKTWLPKSNEWTDPEFSNTTGNAQGVNSTLNSPPTRIWGANLTINF